MSKETTAITSNEEAYKAIKSYMSYDDSPEANLALVFAGEDLAEMDVSQWIDQKPSELMEDFMKHTEYVLEDYLDDLDSATLDGLSTKFSITMKAMILYTDYWWEVKTNYVNNGWWQGAYGVRGELVTGTFFCVRPWETKLPTLLNNLNLIQMNNTDSEETLLYFYTRKGKTFTTPSLKLASARTDSGSQILYKKYSW